MLIFFICILIGLRSDLVYGSSPFIQRFGKEARFLYIPDEDDAYITSSLISSDEKDIIYLSRDRVLFNGKIIGQLQYKKGAVLSLYPPRWLSFDADKHLLCIQGPGYLKEFTNVNYLHNPYCFDDKHFVLYIRTGGQLKEKSEEEKKYIQESNEPYAYMELIDSQPGYITNDSDIFSFKKNQQVLFPFHFELDARFNPQYQLKNRKFQDFIWFSTNGSQTTINHIINNQSIVLPQTYKMFYTVWPYYQTFQQNSPKDYLLYANKIQVHSKGVSNHILKYKNFEFVRDFKITTPFPVKVNSSLYEMRNGGDVLVLYKDDGSDIMVFHNESLIYTNKSRYHMYCHVYPDQDLVCIMGFKNHKIVLYDIFDLDPDSRFSPVIEDHTFSIISRDGTRYKLDMNIFSIHQVKYSEDRKNYCLVYFDTNNVGYTYSYKEGLKGPWQGAQPYFYGKDANLMLVLKAPWPGSAIWDQNEISTTDQISFFEPFLSRDKDEWRYTDGFQEYIRDKNGLMFRPVLSPKDIERMSIEGYERLFVTDHQYAYNIRHKNGKYSLYFNKRLYGEFDGINLLNQVSLESSPEILYLLVRSGDRHTVLRVEDLYK